MNMDGTDLETSAQRLQRARIAAGFTTASEAARAFGWNENTYRSHENGERGLKKSVAEKYAKSFKVNVGQIMFGDAEIDMRSRVSIVGEIGLGGHVKLPTRSSKKYDAQLGLMFNNFVRAFVVEQDANLVVFQPGDLLLVWALNTETDVIFGSYSIVEIDDKTLLRLVQKGSRRGLVHLEFPLMPTMVDASPSAISVVHAIVPQSQWAKIDTETGKEVENPRWKNF